MSKRRRKTQMFDDGFVMELDMVDFEAPRSKRPKGKDWGKARRSNQKAAYWD